MAADSKPSDCQAKCKATEGCQKFTLKVLATVNAKEYECRLYDNTGLLFWELMGAGFSVSGPKVRIVGCYGLEWLAGLGRVFGASKSAVTH